MRLDQSSILIVDDEPILRMTFSILLKQKGARVVTAEDGVEALEILQREHVDVMLTDKQMPRMDGLTLLRTMRSQNLRVPSILFVNGVEPESPSELEQLGVVETANKPLHPDRLQEMLSSVLQPIERAVETTAS